MPALTPEQEALREAAQDLENEPGESFGSKVRVVNRYQRLANPAAILALLAQLEAQEAPTSGDIILCGCMPADLGYAPPKLEWDEAPSVPAQTATKEAALQALVDQAQELDMGYEGVSTLPSTPLPRSALQGGEQDVFFTAVYRVPKKHFAEFASEVCASAFWSAASWSHALDERDAARAALQQPVQAVPDGWISVEDRLPPPETDVFVRVLRGNSVGYDVAGIFHDQWMSFATEADTKGAVTHWAAIRPVGAAPGEPGQ